MRLELINYNFDQKSNFYAPIRPEIYLTKLYGPKHSKKVVSLSQE